MKTPINISLWIIIGFAFGQFYHLHAQTIISGRIIDQTTQEPVEYANVGLPGSETGTVCNAEGEFSLTITTIHPGGPLQISHLNYETLEIYWQDRENKDRLLIQLVPKESVLPTFNIKGNEQLQVGFKPGNDEAKAFFKADGLGMEGGCLIPNNDTLELTTFYMNILELPYDSMKFRLNFYQLKSGRVTQKINTLNIPFVLRKKDVGVYSLSLPPETIVAGNFLCTLELIETFGGSIADAKFMFSALVDKKGVIFKKKMSMGKWERLKHYSLCFWFDAKK